MALGWLKSLAWDGKATLVSAGSQHNVLLSSSSDLFAWGNGQSGQLGCGTLPTWKTKPVAIPGHNWRFVSTGGYHTLAIKLDGSLWGWGCNLAGQVGDGTKDDRPLPAKIDNGLDWRSICGGRDHSVALKTDGSLWAWGGNYHGELGMETDGEKITIPTRLPFGSDWCAISAGGYHSLGLKTNGTFAIWGGLFREGGRHWRHI